ncbi:Rrf2 family transcriptional regulator [Aeoliella sp. ICT_H6.2]|uniref:Rrf2 family transcriptional regulator n=1 Tax=Aeoliella straminimaris TaxID=2954799 RepID=A0A9X2FGK4_9BACT|nr:Rrf2 family transcriptional regulator [Aeoliella straminimaris]
MSISQTAEYALRAVIRLAQQSDEAQTTQQLAEATLVPQSYLPKVLQPLARAGIVVAQRGSHGGYKLQADPAILSVLDVVNCVDPARRVERCIGHDTVPEHRCGLHHLLDDVAAATERRYSETTIQSLLEAENRMPPLCPAAKVAAESNGSSAAPSTLN